MTASRAVRLVRGQKKPQRPHQVVINGGRMSRRQMTRLATQVAAVMPQQPAAHAAPGAAMADAILAKSHAHRFRRQLIPAAWLAALLPFVTVLHLAHAAAVAVVLAVVSAAALFLLTRHLSDMARALAVILAALTLIWLPLLTVAGDSRPWPFFLAACFAVTCWWWAHRNRIRPGIVEQDKTPAGDVVTWNTLAGEKRWHATLGDREAIPGGRRYPIICNGAKTDISEIMGQRRKIAAAWNTSMTSAYAEGSPDGVESRGFLTLLERNTLETTRLWDGRGVDRETGIAVIGRYADGADTRIRIWASRDGTKHGLIAGESGSGKALALDTPVPTPAGWTTMGDIKAGDVVYDDAGNTCTVTAAHPVRHDRPCYAVEFSDGSVVTADADHLWLVDTFASRLSAGRAARREATPRTGTDQRHLRRRPQVIRTEDMLGSLLAGNHGSNYSVRVAAPLQADPADLPIPPYTLGAWLGDGTSCTGTITSADPEIISEVTAEIEQAWGTHPVGAPSLDEIRSWPATVLLPQAAQAIGMGKHQAYAFLKAGKLPLEVATRRPLAVTSESVLAMLGARKRVWAVPSQVRENCANYRVKGLLVALRTLGVLSNKHIPLTYLRASEGQRRALLAGLLDTDGHCTKTGTAEFCNTNERLARDVFHLVATLGYKATLRSKTARIEGRDCGTAWTVAFTPPDKVFRLSRKLSRQVTTVRATAAFRYITDIRPVPSVPVRCITVDSPSHLYLVGEACIPTHNTYLLDLIIRISLASGLVTPFILDPQEGQSLPQWQDALPYAAGIEECMALLERLHKGMLDRSHYLKRRSWTKDNGQSVGFMNFYDPLIVPELPVAMVIADEVAILLADRQYGARAKFLLEAIAKLGRKTGFSLWPVVQVPSLEQLGGSRVLRSMLTGGSAIALRTADKASKNMMSMGVDPSDLPKAFPNGSLTYGLGLIDSMDLRTAPFRTDLIPQDMQDILPEVRPVDDRMAPILEGWRKGLFVRNVFAPPAPRPVIAAAPPPPDDAPEGRRAADAILAVLTREMDRGDICRLAGEHAVREWKRPKPFGIRAIADALRDLSDTGRIAKGGGGHYSPVRPSLHSVPGSAPAATEATR